MRAVKEPCRSLEAGVYDSLTTSGPLGRLQALNERSREFLCDYFGCMCSNELLGQVHRQVGILVLVATSKTCKK